MKITVILRSPFLDKIPSLKNLIIYLAENDVTIKIINSSNSNYPISNLKNKNVKQISSKERTRKIELPTMVKMMSKLINDVIFDKSDYYIGADEQGCDMILKLQKIFPLRYINFLLEYPDIKNNSSINTVQKAEKIITHDKWHSDFLLKECNVEEDKFLYLPNSTFTKGMKDSTTFLHERLNLDKESIILLHSGGFGKWFLCKELAEASPTLSKNQVLVYHGSHNITTSDYFKETETLVKKGNMPVKFSLQPVSDDDLDILVASASIGLAFYSLKELGYRAENMGLAAGKIGNYLKCGVPVIATKVHSLNYLEEFKCGVLIDDFKELPKAVEKILSDLQVYRQNAKRCYQELWEPQKYLDVIFKELKKENEYSSED